MRTLLKIVAVLVAVIAAVVLIRTALHTPSANPSVGAVESGPGLQLDEQAIAANLAAAIRFRTVSYRDPGRVDGATFRAFLTWLAATYPEFVAATERSLHGGFTPLYRLPGSDPGLAPILLTAHYDVVDVLPGTEDDWGVPPWAGEIRDGVIWGRGALDDKSAVIAQLEAASALLATGWRPARSVYFSFGHDEEVGGPRGAAAVTEYLREQGVQLQWSLDEGSFILQGMLPGLPEAAIINVAEKGSVTLDIVAIAAGGHSSMPPRQTAVGRLAEAISKLEAQPLPGGLTGLSGDLFDALSRHMSFGNRLLFANRWLFGPLIEDQLAGLDFGNAMLRTTTAPTMLSASIKSNVLPIEASATVNFRIHPRDTVESVIEHVRRTVADDDIEIRVAPGAGAPASPVSSAAGPGYRAIAAALGTTQGEIVVAPGLMIAGSDSKHYGKVALDAYRFNPMRVTPADLTGFHGTNERIAIANLVGAVEMYAEILRLGAAAD
ncbi:MAG: M20 family peptidase [Pseudomonadota bacterium]